MDNEISVDVRLKRILTKRLGMTPEMIRSDARLTADLGLDSIDLVEMTIAAEQEFGISMDVDLVRDVATIGDVVALIEDLAPAVQSGG